MIYARTRELIEARIRAGLSGRGLARRIGKSSGYISQVERRERCPSPPVAKEICEELGATFDDLFEIKLPAYNEHAAAAGQ